MVALFQGGHAGSNIDHDPRTLMAQNGWKRAFGVIAAAGELVRVTNARRLDFHQYFACTRSFQIDLFNAQWFSSLKGNSGTGFHGWFLPKLGLDFSGQRLPAPSQWRKYLCPYFSWAAWTQAAAA